MPLESIFSIVKKMPSCDPLVLNLTNHVVMNHTANGLLALGASPIMSMEKGEIEELVKACDSVVINIGTLDNSFTERALYAAEMAKKHHKPVVLDPAGAGASQLRRKVSQDILKTGAVSILRGNASEIITLADFSSYAGRGVDSLNAGHEAAIAAKNLVEKYQIAVVISHATDIIVHREHTAFVSIDVPIMTRVTGMGCMASAICGACIAVNDNPFLAGFAGMFIMSVAGSQAYRQSQNIGLFTANFLDALNHIDTLFLQYADRVHVQQS